MITLDVYGVSDWPESYGERFLIFSKKRFTSEEEAIIEAKKLYNDSLIIECEVSGE